MRNARTLIAFSLILLPCLASAQTVMLVSQETVNGGGASGRQAARDGISAGLFEAGFIVFEYDAQDPAADRAALQRVARSAGADLVLQAGTELSEAAAGAGVTTTRSKTTYALTRTDTGAVVDQGVIDVDNSGTEASVDRDGVGLRIGQALASRMAKTLGRPPS
jgi:hypothetical protein